MTNSIIYYVLESSICLILFLMVYRLLIANLTHFSWMRIYLLISVILSLILPVLIIPIQWTTSILPYDLFNNTKLLLGTQPEEYSGGQTILNNLSSDGSNYLLQGIIVVLIVAYISGLLYNAYNFAKNLRSIQNCIKQNPKVRDGGFWFVDLNETIPPFSFFNYIFIANSYQSLSTADLQRIKDHEKVHAQQFHTIDVLFIEFISIVFWFNPLLSYLKKSVQELHEYIVDEKIAETGNGKKDYAQLLLKLASDAKGFNLSAGFSGSQIKRRIIMITRQRSLPKQKLLFVILIPITVLIMLSFSYIKTPDPLTTKTKQNEIINQSQLKIGEIIWKGNTVYDVKALSQAFGLKTGSEFNKSLIEDRINGTLGSQDCVSSLYQNNGYLFSRITIDENQKNGVVDLTMSIYEGKQAKFQNITVKVDGIVTKVPANEIGIQTGDLFSKANILKSIQKLAATGKFDPDKINPKPTARITTDEFDTVDMLYELTAINKK